MKSARMFACLLLATTAVAQAQGVIDARGSINGTAIGTDDKPAVRIGLTATPLSIAPVPTSLPHTVTDGSGRFRFDLPWGKYIIYADDEAAGYSGYSTGRTGQTDPLIVEITPKEAEAKVSLTLPPRAAFLHIQLINEVSDKSISSMDITVLRESDHSPFFDMSCASNKVILLPPDQDLIVHITSNGFHEWKKSAGTGEMLRLSSGQNFTLNVGLVPTD
jgi:hypothetical protein